MSTNQPRVPLEVAPLLVPEVRDVFRLAGQLLVADRVRREMDPVPVHVEHRSDHGDDQDESARAATDRERGRPDDCERSQEVDPVSRRLTRERGQVVEDENRGREGQQRPGFVPAFEHLSATLARRGPGPAFLTMSYAIISLGGKQYRVREGEKLLVDRVTTDEGKTFHPDVLFVGGDGKADFKPKDPGDGEGRRPREGREDPDRQVPRRTGYRRHTGYRSSLSQIEITAIGAKRTTRRQGDGREAAGSADERSRPAAQEAGETPDDEEEGRANGS